MYIYIYINPHGRFQGVPLIGTSSVRRGLHSSTYRGQLANCSCTIYFHPHLEPNWPLFWLEKALFWRFKPQNRGQTGSRYLYRKKKLHSSRTGVRGPPSSIPLPAGPFNPGAGCHRRTRQVEQATKNWRFFWTWKTIDPESDLGRKKGSTAPRQRISGGNNSLF